MSIPGRPGTGAECSGLTRPGARQVPEPSGALDGSRDSWLERMSACTVLLAVSACGIWTSTEPESICWMTRYRTVPGSRIVAWAWFSSTCSRRGGGSNAASNRPEVVMACSAAVRR